MDNNFMRIALELAERAQGRTSPNPLVGAVVVKDGRVIGQGYHTMAGAPHAEIVALEEAGDDARGATVYVNLEPCCHRGRTGPCTQALLSAGVSRVVVAMGDPNPLVSGEGLRQLREGGVEVITGVLEEEAIALNEVFIKFITTKRPFVVSKAAMSIDGKIATYTGQSQWITGAAARAYGHQLRDRYDAILVGRGTVLADNPSLTTRLEHGVGRDPVRIILDSGANTSPEAKVISLDSPAPTIIAATTSANSRKISSLERAGAQVLITNEGSRVELYSLMRKLAGMNITSVLIEGGAQVHGAAFEARIVDKVVWFIAPRIIGGDNAPGPVGGQGSNYLAETPYLDQEKITRLGDDICIESRVTYPSNA
ncbi:MAG: bifunctional diaminohydroxyphosphoribosylaminopyrimidine deaminase/5-amino-6-(5-phosphoribosylamino)uracil reductase RibD [Peptococcaceae bacterium]|nr:bifunctional diaminohydroxyphosphoribosylaminopyrimidine deaminase/5-amino-6-(5-phosphoribosylamino)uracil reductase RibD [Peptococcaceae bacterium]